ncbi:GntR family transcriptional regulator [Roseibium sediminicola]|uniref:GntR family transcriptional regulator n=1 Tax=Roseibium sediminicola TaxID=2933272 RepID=A0ABT0GPL0_9HYPH|nr:GntR family transcriptional regulator [Roseibium sp. CAU 1639]MCK7611372.1 GntR family transcriptional regulator [Roseibium sp. CAU 1639]
MNDKPDLDTADIARQLEEATSAQERFQILFFVLRDRICMLVYPPGTQLSEEALANEFGISRSPLRKALQILEADGLLRSQQGVGTLVTEVDLDELQQVYQLRMELNELTGKLSPATVDAALVQAFDKIRVRADVLRHAPSRSGFARLNIDFFHVFQLLSENQPLHDVAEKLFYQTCRIWLTLIPDQDLASEVAVFCNEVEDIAKAIATHDVSAAALIRRAHLSMGFKRLRRQKSGAGAESTDGAS